MRVEATSSDASATLKAYVTSTGELIGILTNKGEGEYRGNFIWGNDPKQVTVKSSAGGSATATVEN